MQGQLINIGVELLTVRQVLGPRLVLHSWVGWFGSTCIVLLHAFLLRPPQD